ncbi:MAG: hypothetical protein GX327_08690 [Epulopiscium sp.]|nr:hypothetical protein [Candidatus Epulonipiscium sp.]
MKNNINIKVNWKHMSLEYEIRKHDSNQEVSRTALFFRMVEAAADVKDWKNIKLLLSRVERFEEAPMFTNFQAKYDAVTSEKLDKVKEKILYDLKDIKVLQQQYMLQLLMCNYLEDIKEEVLSIGNNINEEEMSAPDMVKILVEIILLDKQSDAINKIKKILKEWKNNN